MKKQITLGISVYPDLSPIEEIKDYIKLASKYGFTRIFSSMFSVEGTNEEVLAYFDELIKFAHQYEMEVNLDVNPMFFEKLGATPDNIEVFNSIGVDILRMDMSYGDNRDLQLIKNPYDIKIEFNASFSTADVLLNLGAKTDDFLLCHNFYPQRYTGLSWERFLNSNKAIKEVGDISVGAFVSSNNENTHGVWDAKEGLPTVERFRDFPIDLQARILLATHNVDTVMIGNAYASEAELRSLSNLKNEDKNVDENPTLKTLVDYGIIDLEDEKVVQIKPTLYDAINDNERDIIFEFYPHMSFGDNSEFIWRSRISRFKYNNPKYELPANNIHKEYFEYGDIVIVNDSYKHYAGEVQIVLKRIKNDGLRNLVGYIDPQEMVLIELLDDGKILKFIK